MTATTAAGTTLSVSLDYPVAISTEGYSTLDYVDIGEVTDPGSTGRVYSPVNHAAVSNRAAKKLKGSYDEGSMSVHLAYAPGDGGQEILASALDDDDAYPFALTLSNGVSRYFLARVMSAPVQPGQVDNIISATVDLSILSGTSFTVMPPEIAGDFHFNNPSTLTFGAI